MRLFLILILSLITTVTFAADTIYVSSLTNGTPPSLNVAKFSRTTVSGPLNFVSSISLILQKAGGVTSIQPNGTTQLHVYRTELVGSKARIVRETVDLATFTFVVGSTKNFPANLFTLHNFDSNDALALVQKLAGTRLHFRPVNPPGNVVGGFRPLPSLPAAPFGGHISDGKPFFFSALWIDPASRRTGVTFANTTAPANATSFLFSNPILAQDMSLSFPRENAASGKTIQDDIDYFWYLVNEEDLTKKQALKIVIRRIIRRSRLGQIRAADFKPTGNVITIAPPRFNGNIPAVQFNGVGIDPLAVAIAYERWNSACGNNEIILQTFNPVTGRKVGPLKFAKRCVRGFVNYGISVFNTNFKNGVTND